MAIEIYVATIKSHLEDPEDAHDASAIKFSPSGDITADNVQDAVMQAAASAAIGIPDGSITEDKLAFDPVTQSELDDLDLDNTPDSYIHVQSAAASVWTIIHNLDFYPSVTVVDTFGTVIIGDIEYNTSNTLTVSFSAPFSGRAYLS